MRLRHVMIALAGGLLAGLVAAVAPATAENPMTPLRPVGPEKSTGAAAGSSPPATAAEPASMPGTTPALMPGNAAAADSGAMPPPRARGRARRDRAAAGIRPGRWEFTARLQTPAAASSSAPAAGGGMQTTYTTCIESDNAVPADLGPQCRLERHDRRGSRISWAISCANTGVHADGLAQYRGDTMQATVISHIPAAAGRVTTMTQHLTGRYLGSCLPTAAVLPPAGQAAPINVAGSSEPAAAMPATGSAANTDTKPDTASEPAPAHPEAARHPGRHGRHAHRSHRRHHGRSGYRTWYGRGSSFGPSPTSSAGP